jgi:O-antigen/teichoic acid export membrane protein
MNKYKKLALNTAVFAVGSFGSKILVFLLTRLYTKYISPADMNTKDLLETVALFLLPIFTFSLTEAIIRFGLDERYDKKEIFTTAGSLTLKGLGAMVVIVPFLHFVPFLDFMSGYTVLLIVYTICSAMRSLCAQFIRARDMVKLFSLDGILATLTLFIFNIILIAHFHMGVKGFMLSVILSDSCSAIFLFIVAKLHNFVSADAYSSKLARKMMKFSLPLVPAIVMWTITGLSDRLFIRCMHSDRVELGASAAGIYGVANRIPNLISMVSTIFFQAWNMSAITENESADRSDFYEKVYGAYESILFIASAGLILLVKPISSFMAYSGTFEAYADVYKYTPILVIAVLFTCLNQFLGSIYTATKHTVNSFWTSLIACVVNIILNICLIPEWGIQGASIATFLSYYVCFWARIIDARYYVPFKFNARRSLMNTGILFVMCWLILAAPKLWGFWLFVLCCVVLADNYKSLLATFKKLLHR